MPRFPPPLRPGSTIACTAPSSGFGDSLRARFDLCVQRIEARGYRVEVGRCLVSDGIVSAPAADRAAELEAFLSSDRVDAVMPPWGGELAIELLPLVRWDALALARPKWLVGWSDVSTLQLPLLTLASTASLHGMNLMDAAFHPAPGAAGWWDVLGLEAGAAFSQTALTHHQRGFRRYQEHPAVDRYTADVPTRWRRLGGSGDVTVRGRLIGGCADVCSRLVGTPYGDVPRFARDQAPDGALVFLENCEMTPADAARCWHQLVLAGWFDRASAVLLGRTPAADEPRYSQHDAIAHAFEPVVRRGVPVLYDLDIGHQPPQLLIVQGADAELTYRADGTGALRQRLG